MKIYSIPGVLLAKYKFEYDLWFAKRNAFKQPQKGIMNICHPGDNYYGFTASYAQDMLALILFAVGKGYMPRVLIGSENNDFSFDTFFLQPFTLNKKITVKKENIVTCELLRGPVHASFSNIFRRDVRKFFGKAFEQYLILNEKTREYVNDDYRNIIKPGMKVLGVLCRGTDYLRLKPPYHPIQPEIEDVLSEVGSALNKYNYTHIYVATEDENYVEIFEKEFPNKILVNKRHYIGDLFTVNSQLTHVHQVRIGVENETYIKGIEYLSSLEILAKCDGLIAGNCGGSIYSLLRNNNKYEYWKIFNLGLYPPN